MKINDYVPTCYVFNYTSSAYKERFIRYSFSEPISGTIFQDCKIGNFEIVIELNPTSNSSRPIGHSFRFDNYLNLWRYTWQNKVIVKYIDIDCGLEDIRSHLISTIEDAFTDYISTFNVEFQDNIKTIKKYIK